MYHSSLSVHDQQDSQLGCECTKPVSHQTARKFGQGLLQCTYIMAASVCLGFCWSNLTVQKASKGTNRD